MDACSFSWLKRRLHYLNLKRKGIHETDSTIIRACRAIQVRFYMYMYVYNILVRELVNYSGTHNTD